MKKILNEALKDSQFQKNILWINGAVPAIMLGYDLVQDRLGANPPEAIIRTTGVVAIVFLTLTLAVTPVSQIWSQTWLIKHRRWLGLWSFYYALLHLISYSIFDKGFSGSDIVEDIVKRPFILLGFVSFLLLLPLAVTSTNEMIKRLGGKTWKSLHKITYLIAPLVVAHYWLIVKSDLYYPILFAIATGILLVYRIRNKLNFKKSSN